MKLFIKALLFASLHWRRSSLASFVAMKSLNFPLTPSLCAPRPLASCGIHLLPVLSSSGTSPFGVLPPVNTILQELRHVSHCLVYNNHSHFAHCYCCCPLHVLSLLVHSYPSPQWFSCQDDGLSSRVDHHCPISVFYQPYSAISLSPYLRGPQHLHLFSLTLLTYPTLKLLQPTRCCFLNSYYKKLNST